MITTMTKGRLPGAVIPLCPFCGKKMESPVSYAVGRRLHWVCSKLCAKEGRRHGDRETLAMQAAFARP